MNDRDFDIKMREKYQDKKTVDVSQEYGDREEEVDKNRSQKNNGDENMKVRKDGKLLFEGTPEEVQKYIKEKLKKDVKV